MTDGDDGGDVEDDEAAEAEAEAEAAVASVESSGSQSSEMAIKVASNEPDTASGTESECE